MRSLVLRDQESLDEKLSPLNIKMENMLKRFVSLSDLELSVYPKWKNYSKIFLERGSLLLEKGTLVWQKGTWTIQKAWWKLDPPNQNTFLTHFFFRTFFFKKGTFNGASNPRTLYLSKIGPDYMWSIGENKFT